MKYALYTELPYRPWCRALAKGVDPTTGRLKISRIASALRAETRDGPMKKICCFLCLSLISTSLFAADDWPYYRGPDRNGGLASARFAKDADFGFEIDWKRNLGSGYAAISVVGRTGVTMYTDGASDILMAFDTETGEERWHYDMGPIYKGHSGSQDGPTGTPTIDGSMVYALDPHGRLVAVTLEKGTKKWEYHLGRDVPARVPHYGFNTVPTVAGRALIVMTGSQEGGAFTAFDKITGEQLWRSGDDTTTYQSPLIWERAGKTYILGVTDNHLMELDPADGRVLWQQEHKVLDNESYMLPLLMGDNRVLVSNRRGAAGFELKWKDGRARMKELWRGNAFQRTYALPVYHEGYLYGFRAQFLGCVDPADGEVLWRSRPPGGQGLSLLGDHLIILGKQGDLVAVEATPVEYREKARIKLFDQSGYTAASFAGGHLFLRNLKEMARVRITDHATVAEKTESEPLEPKGILAALLLEVERAGNKKAKIDAFMARHQQFPIIEEGGLVHYVYRGEMDDIGVSRGFEREVPLSRIPGTTFFFYSEELDLAGHWEYNFSSYADRLLDPLNPLVIGEGARARNELRMPNWPVPDYLQMPSGPRGRVEDLVLPGPEGSLRPIVKVYLPAGYDDSEQRYPLLLVINGMAHLETAKMDVVLDNLIGNRIAPIIVAFVPAQGQQLMGDGNEAHANMVADVLLPALDERYRTTGDPATRGLMGTGSGAIGATYTAFHKPGAFGKLASQSFVFPAPLKAKMIESIENADSSLAAFVEISSNDYKFPSIDAEQDSRELLALLQKKGHSVKVHHTVGAPGFASWRGQTGIILEWFAPK